MSIYVIGNNSNNAHGLEFPQIELRNLGGALQYRILGRGISAQLAKLNPRLVLFRRVRQNRSTKITGRKLFKNKVQYVITRPDSEARNTSAVEFKGSGNPDSEGWITLNFASDNTPVTPFGILNLFSPPPIRGVYKRRSRNFVNFGLPTWGNQSNYFAQYYGIGFACDNPNNSQAMNQRGQNLLYQHIAQFKAGVSRDGGNQVIPFFRVKTN